MAASSRVAGGGTASGISTESRPILLATVMAPFDPRAASFAVDAAVESGQPLIVAVIVPLEPLPMSIALGYDQIDSPADAESFLAPAELAHSLGVRVERLRIRSPRPVDALIEVAAERQPGLLVFGPDRSRLSTRRYRKAAKAVRERVTCLVWMPED